MKKYPFVIIDEFSELDNEMWKRLKETPTMIIPQPKMEVIQLKKGINDYCEMAFSNAIEKGFHDEERPIAVALALIHSEVSEALEADRKGNEENFKEELADICIRVFDLAGSLDIDLELEIEKKMIKNIERPRKHGKRY